jgi:CRISPR-associated protein Csm5
MILNLRTLTPLHIGDGTQLHAFDYTIHEGRFYRTSQKFFDDFLEKIGGDAPEQFVEWSANIFDQMENLESDKRRDPRMGRDINQKMSDLRKQHTIKSFAKFIKQEPAFLAFLKEKKVPSLPLIAVGKGEKEKQEIRGFLRAGDGRPYLPGSSFKGAIRTALLFNFLENHSNLYSDIYWIYMSIINILSIIKNLPSKCCSWNKFMHSIKGSDES